MTTVHITIDFNGILFILSPTNTFNGTHFGWNQMYESNWKCEITGIIAVQIASKCVCIQRNSTQYKEWKQPEMSFSR